MSRLTFATLRCANIARLPLFKNSKGVVAHSQADGSDWSLLEWAGALCGEAGELANLLKKVRRGDKTLDEARADIAKELADNVIYLDIIASQAGIDLGAATVAKFNETSRKTGVDVLIVDDIAVSKYSSVQVPIKANHVSLDGRPTDSGEFPLSPGLTE